MLTLIEQVNTLLTTPPGNLTYHLVLTFSILVALVAAINHWRYRKDHQNGRAVFGLGLLLAIRLILSFLAALALSGTVSAHFLLPPVDRSVTALGIVVIVWLWGFPDSSRLGNIVASLTGLLAITVTALGLIIWSGESADTAFNAFWLSDGWEYFSMALIAIGVFLLIAQQPPLWGQGFAMLGILFLGHLGQIFFPDQDGNFPGAVRLAQIAAYPLLFMLTQRIWASPVQTQASLADLDKSRQPLHISYLDDFLSMAASLNVSQLCYAITRVISRVMMADVCFMVKPPDADGNMAIQCGYNLISGQEIKEKSIPASSAPILASAIEQNRPIRLFLRNTSKDLSGLRVALGTEKSGHMLAAPLSLSDSSPMGLIALTSPYSNHNWSIEEQTYLTNVAQSLARVIQTSYQVSNSTETIAQLREALKASRVEAERAIQENQALLSENDQLRQIIEDTPPSSDDGLEKKLEIMMAENEETQSIIAYLEAELKKLQAEKSELAAGSTQVENETQELVRNLQTENEKLIQDLEDIRQQLLVAKAGITPTAPSQSHLERELRKALSEVARMQKLLGESEIKILQLNRQLMAVESSERWEMIVTIAQEIRQPMSSIVGYSDFLLSESVGILGALQRKFVERVKTSTDRMNAMVEDLVQIASMEAGHTKLALGIVDLTRVIDVALTNTSPQIREKNISLRMDLPENLPQLQGDKEAIQLILTHLLQNAGSATPVEGEMSIAAGFESYGENQDYVLIQITDSGGGIPSEDLQRVFERQSEMDYVAIQGLGESTVGLVVSKTLVEAHGGRIWVDTESGVGSTFSVLLPLTQSPPTNILANWRN